MPVEQRALGLLLAGGDGQKAANEVMPSRRSALFHFAVRPASGLTHLYDMKIASEKIEVQLPRTAIVEVVDPALPALRPISPNLPRALTLVTLGLLLELVGLLRLTGWPQRDKMPTSREP
jgi:hypothetical protein